VRLPNVPQFLVTNFGILKASLVMVPMNPLLTVRHPKTACVCSHFGPPARQPRRALHHEHRQQNDLDASAARGAERVPGAVPKPDEASSGGQRRWRRQRKV
jgi:acyl-CoA synthetase (AMP-forming)/AMP-acid ligase II